MATANKNLSDVNVDIDLKQMSLARTLKVTLVVAKWNKEITSSLKDGAVAALLQLGLYKRNITVIHVPGSFELPYAASQVISNKEVDAVICIGSVIKGETSHFDYVCQGVTYGIQELNVRGDVPVIFCVLTDNNLQQSKDRSGGKHGNKGVEAAVTAVEMVQMKRDLSQ
jgi:6,7-dimethyl-8-ribityllumazine synthase